MSAQTVLVPDRRKAVLLLAGSLYDFFPAPRAASFKQRAEKKKGGGEARVATHFEPCRECPGSGWKKDRWRRRPCENECGSTCKTCGVPCAACGGYDDDVKGPQGGKGVIAVDRMVQDEYGQDIIVGTDKTYAPPPRDEWPCNFCFGLNPKAKRGTGVSGRDANGNDIPCGPCGGTGTRSSSRGVQHDVREPEVVDVTLTAVERGIERRAKIGSYHELDVALSELASRSVHRWRVFHAVHVVKTSSLGLLSGTEATLLEQAVQDLLRFMPQRIMVPAEVLAGERRLRQPAPKGKTPPRDMLAGRDAEIRAAYESGLRTPEIAAEYGLSTSQVQRVLNRAA